MRNIIFESCTKKGRVTNSSKKKLTGFKNDVLRKKLRNEK
jgi:hypothetical protein